MNTSELENLLKALGKAVGERRKEKQLSQEELANNSKLHRTYISDIENGKRNCTLGAFICLSKGLCITPVELLKRAEEISNRSDTKKKDSGVTRKR